MSNQNPCAIKYFDQEGRQNLGQVLKTVCHAYKREDVRSCKLVIFTSFGEGPALAYNKLAGFRPKIIAVTYPPGFSVKKMNDDGVEMEIPVRISDQLRKFFDGVEIKVLSSRMPLSSTEGAEATRHEMKLIRDVLSLYGSGFSACVQAVLQACDMGEVEVGERVVSMSGDCAAIITASSSAKFLCASGGLSINEILCKPRNLTLTRKQEAQKIPVSGDLFPVGEPKLLPPR
jgi:hypothetical protein